MAGWTGLEPAASGVTGRRSNQLNYHPKIELQTCKASVDFSPTLYFPVYSLKFKVSLLLVGGTGFEPVTAGV